MTIIEDRPGGAAQDADQTDIVEPLGADLIDDAADVPSQPAPDAGPDLRPRWAELLRPAAASALVSLGAGFGIGGIFGSWFARGLGGVAALVGAGAAVVAQRSNRRSGLLLAFPFIAVKLSLVTLL